ncbi:vacuolar iron transporter like protein 4 [Quercus suber]|uniref:Vacuolar iron transporter like protein 4 n=1 Tax=Quercus suber TaxID=58331 RepID=A0AAW0LAF8_QUESU
MAIGEFISACSQYYIDKAQMKRECSIENMGVEEIDAEKEKLSNPWHGLSIDSAFSFLVGTCVWLLLGVKFVKNCVRVGLIMAVVSFALLLFGGLGSIPAGTAVKSSLRVLLGGLVAMGVSCGFTKLVDSAGILQPYANISPRPTKAKNFNFFTSYKSSVTWQWSDGDLSFVDLVALGIA